MNWKSSGLRIYSININCAFSLLSIGYIFFFSNCSNTRFLQQNEILLHKNKIKIELEEHFVRKFVSKSEMTDELSILFKQTPNTKAIKILNLFNFRLWVYNQANKKIENKRRWWWKNKVGEPPVILDSALAFRTARNMENYLYNKGHLYPQVDAEISIRKKRATVTYHVNPREIYTIREVIFPDGKDELTSIIKENSSKSVLKSGSSFDTETISSERERIANDFKNQGYFNYNKEFIYFDIDSSDITKQVDVYIKLHYPEDSSVNKIYLVNNVTIFTNFSSEKNNEKNYTDTLLVGDYTFIGPSLKIKPEILLDDIFLKKGTRYSMNDYQLTVTRLSDIGIFKFIDVYFKISPYDSVTKNYLDCYIYLITGKKQEVTLEGELSTGSENYLGLAGKFTYRNKNLFNRADMFIWNLNAGVESQFLNKNNETNIDNELLRNIDFNNQFNLYLSEYIGPKKNWFSKQFNPKTRLAAGYNFLQRVDLYNLSSVNFLFGYDWKEFTYKRHNFNPLSLNFVLINNKTDLFISKLGANPLLKNSFIDQVIIGSNYNFTFNNQQINKLKNFSYFRVNLDVAGLSAKTISGITNGLDFSNTRYKIAGIAFAQFVRADIDLRHYNIFNQYTTFVSRFSAGIGTAYWNSKVMPYIKQFYVGGQYSIRAWRVRELGPGSYTDTSEISIFPDQTGDMKIEANVEFRYKILGVLRGAFFADAGNVWVVRKEETREGTSFSKSFINEIAIGPGAGLRFDFTFFIIRLDVAFKLYDPSFDLKDRWRWENADMTYKEARRKLNINLAIGYPF